MRIIIPRTLVQIDWTYGPLFFLAGPVRGGNDWQWRACKILYERLSQFYAAIPFRYGDKLGHPIFQYLVKGCDDIFDRQLPWERHYLALSAKRNPRRKNCLIIWHECESKTNPRGGPEPYAMDTRGETGEWRGRLIYDPDINLVVGADVKFFGLSQIRRNFEYAVGNNFPIYSTLEETLAAAVEMANSPEPRKYIPTEIVHALLYGKPLCKFSEEVPAKWPKGHKWVAAHDLVNITCSDCKEQAKKILNP